jgi:hypothetical protein
MLFKIQSLHFQRLFQLRSNKAKLIFRKEHLRIVIESQRMLQLDAFQNPVAPLPIDVPITIQQSQRMHQFDAFQNPVAPLPIDVSITIQ